MMIRQTSSLSKRALRPSPSCSLRQLYSTAITSGEAAQGSLITRHGAGDGVITLNVGGKNFLTLRSTISQNAVLSEYVARAEANKELAQEAVFIDRDSKHFGVILSYLRNKADGILNQSLSTRLLKKVNDGLSAAETVYLPQDQQSLQELYYESLHYDIQELASYICTKGFFVKYLQMFGAKNPFQMAASALAVGRRILVFIGTVVTGVGGWTVVQATIEEAQTKQSFDAKSVNENGCESLSNNELILSNVLKAWEATGKK
ncbi:hypothetical protein ACHAWO_008645 [Cyclotella atomus]|uniref:Potassium channel tetramerisation-type BTB domain-containing protein n=1 Tax=Cyclotella atomus TaxID=382360 RepID=A0ABD3MSH8_9STRA